MSAGAVLSTSGLMLAIYTIVTSTRYGWSSGHTVGFGSSAVVVLAAFFVLESRLANPMMPLRVLRSRGLGSTSLARGLMVVGMYGTFFLGALYLQHLLGFDALQTGLAFLPQTLAVALVSLGPSAWLMKVLQPKRTALVGFGSITTGLVLFATSGPQTEYFPQLFFALLLIGIGGALAFTPLLTIGVANIPPADAGLGSGLVNVSQQVSGGCRRRRSRRRLEQPDRFPPRRRELDRACHGGWIPPGLHRGGSLRRHGGRRLRPPGPLLRPGGSSRPRSGGRVGGHLTPTGPLPPT